MLFTGVLKPEYSLTHEIRRVGSGIAILTSSGRRLRAGRRREWAEDQGGGSEHDGHCRGGLQDWSGAWHGSASRWVAHHLPGSEQGAGERRMASGTRQPLLKTV